MTARNVRDVSVVIVNHETREHLRACLESVRAEGPGEIVVVDNASTDGSAGMVRAAFPEVRLIENEGNPGYSAAVNQGVALCRSPFILLLNSDTRVRPGALEALGRELDQHPRAAVVGRGRVPGWSGTSSPGAAVVPIGS